jgi:hypothetical protein
MAGNIDGQNALVLMKHQCDKGVVAIFHAYLVESCA